MSRRGGNPLVKVLSVLVLGAILIFGSMYFIMVMGATDTGVDLSNTTYEAQYNTSTDIATTSMSIMSFAPYLVAVLGLLFGLAAFKIKFK